ncbi:MAG: hypothetical protein ABSH22_21895, partial [Tepidisphaeraceae bacterium]
MEVSIYRLRTTDVLILCVLALLCLGVVMVQSAGANAAGANGWGWSLGSGGSKQIFFASASFIAFLLVGRINYAWLCRTSGHWRSNPMVWMLFIALL